MRLIALPALPKAGDDAPLTTRSIAAAATGTLAQMLSPSLVLIVLVEYMDVPLIDIFHAALLPSAMQVGFYLLFVLVMTGLRPSLAAPIAAVSKASRR